MPVAAVYQSIHDDQVGEGQHLAFPTMSSCAAIIAVMANSLVGIHKTQGWHATQIACFREAGNLIAGRAISELFIAGWNTDNNASHDINQIRTDLNCTAVDTYVYNYANSHFMTGRNPAVFRAHGSIFRNATADLCTFASWEGAGVSPTIGVKRTAKVGIQGLDNAAYNQHLAQHGGYAVGRYYSTQETITTPSGHRHIIQKNTDFRRV